MFPRDGQTNAHCLTSSFLSNELMCSNVRCRQQKKEQHIVQIHASDENHVPPTVTYDAFEHDSIRSTTRNTADYLQEIMQQRSSLFIDGNR